MTAPPGAGRFSQAAATTACLVGLALAYFWPLLRQTEPFSLGGDFAAQTYPWRRYVTAALFQGRLPHWAPEIAFGFPLLADIETNVFYPIGLLVSLLNGPDISFRALELQLVLHHVVGGLGMSLLLRRMGCLWPAALCGAIVFGFSGFLWAHGAHLTIVQSASWGPWVLLGGVALVDRISAPALVGAAITLALAILGGHPQMPFYIGLALLVIVGAGAWRPAAGSAGQPLPRVAAAVAVAGLLAVGLTAVQLLPTAVLTRYSIRWMPPAWFLQADVLPPENLLTLLVPLAYYETPRWVSVDEFHGYVGILPLILALWALAHRRTRWTHAFAILAGMGLVLATGPPPFHWIAQAGIFRASGRAIYLFDLGIAGLAGLGVSALLTPPESVAERRFQRVLWSVVAGASAGAVWLSWQGLPASLGRVLSPEFVFHYRAFVALLVAAAIVLAAARRWRRTRWLAGGLLVAVLTVEILSFPRYLAWSGVPPDGWWPPRNGMGALPRNVGPHRILNDGFFGRAATMEANVGLVYDVPLPTVYTSLYLARYARFHDELLADPPRTANLYDLMGVRWVTSRRDLPQWVVGPRAAETPGPSDAAERIVGARPGLWEVRDALPRAYLPTEIRVVGSPNQAFRALPALDPHRAVILERRPLGCLERPLRAGAPGDVQFLLDEPDRVRLRVRAANTGQALVVSDTYYPGWHATIDGQPVQIYHANFLFRAVCVPAGEHMVEFAFTPPGFRLGLVVTLLSVASVALILARRGALLDWRRRGAWRDGDRRPTAIRSKRTPL